jgi:hypothetical protein
MVVAAQNSLGVIGSGDNQARAQEHDDADEHGPCEMYTGPES